MRGLKQTAQKILGVAKIKIGGKNPWDIKINNDKIYQKVLAQGSLGLGESYMDGWWDCKKLDEFFNKIIRAGLENKINERGFLRKLLQIKLTNVQNKKRAYEVGKKHYDIGNDLYKLMLDKRMVYSCGYWKNAKTLDEAQEAKLDLICKKMGLKPRMKILDIGCGWGSFLKFAAKKYKVKGVGITISKEQKKLAEEICKGLPVEIRLQDYRDVNEKFDRIISIGMFEHVGPKNYRTYMKVVNRCLKDDGMFLLHTIGVNTPKKVGDRWFNKYIFPNSALPSPGQIINSSEGLLVLEDWHNFGEDYDKTLIEWHRNFNKNWNKIKKNYDERFRRMWNYYLLASAGGFRVKRNRLWQIVYSKNGVEGGYKPVR